jgi:hypothetical protein
MEIVNCEVTFGLEIKFTAVEPSAAELPFSFEPALDLQGSICGERGNSQ